MDAVTAGPDLYGALHWVEPRTWFYRDGLRRAIAGVGDQPDAVVLEEALADIPRAVRIWWSNLNYEDMVEAGIQSRPDIKATNYLPTRPSAVIAELGLESATQDVQVRSCARVFSDVMTSAASIYGLPVEPVGQTLPEALRAHFFRSPARAPDVPEDVQYAIDAAAQAVTTSGALDRRSEHSRVVVLRHHRQQYAAEMLAEPVPFGDWRRVEVPADRDGQLAWVRDNADLVPALMRVRVSFVGPGRHERLMLSGFGSGGRAGTVVRGDTQELPTRQWVATPEFLALAGVEGVEIEVLDAFCAEGFQPNPWMMIAPQSVGPTVGVAQIAIGPITLGGRTALSYAHGLLSEAMWVGAARRRGAHRDAISMWMQSVDRAKGIRDAFALHAHQFFGVDVTGFGRGRIWLRVNGSVLPGPEDVAQTLAEISAITGLLPPVLPPVVLKTSKRFDIASALRARAHEQMKEDAATGSALLAAAMNVLGNRFVLDGVK